MSIEFLLRGEAPESLPDVETVNRSTAIFGDPFA